MPKLSRHEKRPGGSFRLLKPQQVRWCFQESPSELHTACRLGRFELPTFGPPIPRDGCQTNLAGREQSDRFEFSIQLLDVLSTEEPVDSVGMVVVHADGVANLFPLDRGMEKPQF